MATTWYFGKIINIADETATVKRFTVEVQDCENFEFRAGQFITMDLPIGEKRLQRWRSYSIASAPDGSNILEFCIGRLEGGLGTTYLFEEAGLGTMLKFKGPDGNFCLSEQNQKDIVMICTGTGVAPFYSIIQDFFSKKNKNSNTESQKFHLIFGCRYEKDILYQKELQDWATRFPNFKYNIVLSREKIGNYSEGYVHHIYLNNYAKKTDNVHFMLCGWSAMIDEAVENLMLKIGYDRTQIQYELYG